MLVFPEQVLHGAIPNRDFLHLYGPGKPVGAGRRVQDARHVDLDRAGRRSGATAGAHRRGVRDDAAMGTTDRGRRRGDHGDHHPSARRSHGDGVGRRRRARAVGDGRRAARATAVGGTARRCRAALPTGSGHRGRARLRGDLGRARDPPAQAVAGRLRARPQPVPRARRARRPGPRAVRHGHPTGVPTAERAALAAAAVVVALRRVPPAGGRVERTRMADLVAAAAGTAHALARAAGRVRRYCSPWSGGRCGVEAQRPRLDARSS